MSTIEQLLRPVFEGGIRSINFFNGRVLSGEDLSREQEAQRQARRLLGQTAGEGVAFGFEVSEAPGPSTGGSPVITVTPGLAVNRAGQTLRLHGRADVGLDWREDSPAAGASNVTFRDCAPLDPAIYVASESVYLLTVAPAEGREGRAPSAGAGNVPAAFNTGYLVEGVQFRVLVVLTGENLGDRKTLRNRVAYACFGVEGPRGVLKDPFGTPLDTHGRLDELRALEELTDCEVPLALVYWSNVRGIEFIDMWPVRRRLTAPAHSRRWHALVGDRREAEAEAMLLQFQDQVADLAASGVNLSAATAAQHFRYLPPAGLLPVARRGPPGRDFNGVNPNTFFGTHAVRPPAYIDGAAVRSLLADAAHYEPVDLARGEAVWLYQVVQNEQAYNAPGAGVQPYLVFTSAQMPYRGAARLNLARFDQSNFA